MRSCVPLTSYLAYVEKALRELEDKDDAPFLALAMALGVGLWTEDKGFAQQNLVKTYDTRELVRMLRNA